jgi:capsid protein
MRKLRSENQAMKKEKDITRVMVEDLKEQMMIGLQAAVDKTQALQKQLDAVTAENEELKEQLRQARQTD